MLDALAHAGKRRPIAWGDGSKRLLCPIGTLSSKWYVREAGKDAVITQAMTTDEAAAKFAGAAARMRVL